MNVKLTCSCGATLEMPNPLSIYDTEAILKPWMADHRECAKGRRGYIFDSGGDSVMKKGQEEKR